MEPVIVRAADLDLPPPNPAIAIQQAAVHAYQRQDALTMGELIAGADRVFEGRDGSVWVLENDPGPGVELRGWPIWP